MLRQACKAAACCHQLLSACVSIRSPLNHFTDLVCVVPWLCVNDFSVDNWVQVGLFINKLLNISLSNHSVQCCCLCVYKSTWCVLCAAVCECVDVCENSLSKFLTDPASPVYHPDTTSKHRTVVVESILF